MNRIKILFIGYGTNLGGIETYLFNLVKNADLEKFEFSFLVWKSKKDIVFKDELLALGCKIFEITPRTKNYLRFIKELKSIYISNYFDFIHFNLMDLSCFERITYANKYSDAKLIVHSHCGSSDGIKQMNILSRFMHKIGLKKLKKIKTLNAACGKKAGIWMHGKNNFITFNNGIDIKKFSYSIDFRREIRSRYKIDDSTTIIGLVAGFFEIKNHRFLIDVFNEYLNMNKNSKMFLIGEGPMLNIIKAKVGEMNLENDILFLGKIYDTYKYYSTLDCYIMPSFSEGLSISLCEAQINGLKCYTSDGVDKNSNITGNVEFLSLTKSAKEWAEYIYNNDNKRDNNVIKKIPIEYDSKQSCKKVYDFYEDNLK